jgi:hypothetical protein
MTLAKFNGSLAVDIPSAGKPLILGDIVIEALLSTANTELYRSYDLRRIAQRLIVSGSLASLDASEGNAIVRALCLSTIDRISYDYNNTVSLVADFFGIPRS